MDKQELIEFADRIAETRAFRRIRDVSFLGAIDHRLKELNPNLTVFSRAEHSLGVLSLAMRVCGNAMLSQADAKALVATALLHDIAHPAYSHSLEYAFARDGRSLDHHEALRLLLTHPSQRTHDLLRVLGAYGVDPHRIWLIVEGVDPLSFLFLNPINLDTIDGITRAYWSINKFVSYDVRILADFVAKIYYGERVASAIFLQHADTFWRTKNLFYNDFLARRAATIENNFQHQVRDAIEELDASYFWMNDKEFALRHPDVMAKAKYGHVEGATTFSQTFEIDDRITVMDKDSIYKRYKRVKYVGHTNEKRAAGAG